MLTKSKTVGMLHRPRSRNFCKNPLKTQTPQWHHGLNWLLITFYLNGGQAWMTCLTLKMTEKFTGCQEYQPRLELWNFRKRRRHSRGLYIRVFLLAMQKDAAIISTWPLIAVLYLFDLSKSTEDWLKCDFVLH